jgi:hypothetical protein
MGITCAYDGCMNTTTFTSKNTTFKIIEMKQHNDNFTAQLGWTHFAAVQRLNGRKTYYANLLIVDGVVLNDTVVL